ncbi:hypothetical protein Q4574_10560 [Aliiglaciecola sp. 3_MG-2023]|uniref:hypothetical protein n=1 Tax=Aliiglaciecola sp. 3_MG-2023 TaxID=3062644 RepID=UPI0026E40B3A|nr:hypothetical protein [Aliiglaciecola sp. 3_MG-2023]MDO6693729.1 hypothetical protein [Aliiglaciecola sp. 3_MG-2023]
MGLYVHSLGELPAEAERAYYLYVLDYGWHERLGDALERNLSKMMGMASQNDAVVIKGVESIHFNNEIFSYHDINGESGDEVLPGILITTLHPKYFRENEGRHYTREELNEHMLLIPLRNYCSNSDDVVSLITKVFKDISEKKKLTDFSIVKKTEKNGFRSFLDTLILQPNVAGVGIDIKKIGDLFSSKNSET